MQDLVERSTNKGIQTIVSHSLSLAGGLLLLGFRALSLSFPMAGAILGGGLIALGMYTTARNNNVYDKKGGSMSVVAGALLISALFPILRPISLVTMRIGGLFFAIRSGIQLFCSWKKYRQRHNRDK